MAYTEKDEKRLVELLQKIEDGKKHEYSAPTYKDTPYLKEMQDIVKNHLDTEQPYDKDTLTDSISVLRYLAGSYEKMCRVLYAEEMCKRVLELQSELYKRYSLTEDGCDDDYYRALRLRNYYKKDTCEDLSKLMSEILPESSRIKIEEEVSKNYPSIKRDPIELSEEYLSVIDEVERRMDEAGADKMHTFERIDLKAQLLSEYGVFWRSEIIMNPKVHFD
ncbi:hypothetical protein ACTQ3J_07155 [Oscillospiraceae bacterium LCP25S3_E3]